MHIFVLINLNTSYMTIVLSFICTTASKLAETNVEEQTLCKQDSLVAATGDGNSISECLQPITGKRHSTDELNGVFCNKYVQHAA